MGVLVSGCGVVFAVDKQTSERVHLFTVEPGDSIPVISCTPGEDWQFVLVPLETSCIEDVAEDLILAAQENSVCKLGEAIAQFSGPRNVEAAHPGKLVFPLGKAIGTDAGLLFVRLDKEAGSLAGGRIQEGSTVALAPGVWMEGAAVDRTAEMEWTVLPNVPPNASEILQETIRILVHAFLALLRATRQRRGCEERARLDVHRQTEQRMLNGVLRYLAEGDRRRDESTTGAEASDHIEMVFRSVVAALGCVVRERSEIESAHDRLRALARSSGLRTRVVLLSGKWWRRENGPLVAYRDNGAPVALLPVRGGVFRRARYELYDPGAGLRQDVNEVTASDLRPFACTVYRPLPTGLTARELFRWLRSTQSGDLRAIALAGIASAVLAVAAPQGASILISLAIPDADVNVIWQVTAGMVAAALGSAVFLFAQAAATHRAQTAVWHFVQTGTWDHLLKLSPSFFRGFTVGQLRLQADGLTRIHQLLTADALRSIFAGVAAFFTLLFIFFYSLPLGLIGLLSGVIVIGVCWSGSRSLVRIQQEWQDSNEMLSGLVLQMINAVSKLRVAGATNRAFAQWAREYNRKQRGSTDIRRIRDRIRLVNLTMPAVTTTFAFLWLLQSPTSTGAFLACITALNAFLAAITAASDTVAGLTLITDLWRRLQLILAIPPEAHTTCMQPGRLRGGIRIEGLTFRYRQDGPLVLDGVFLAAAPGECVAVTGPSGSGKSTLLNLILRFESPQSGAIYLDGRELSSLDIEAVRRQIGVVTQDGRLMSGSIFENICTGGVGTMEDAWEAARAAGLAGDIEAMPMGMHTVVSEGGGNLSGGQRQRLLIARALVLKPPILIFDEATSALDNKTQAIVTESLKRLKATRIVVAHRLSTIRSADRIYVIENGRVTQSGTYSELVKEPGLFARLVSRQAV
jgi:NHLM bacteriocin system ABC transporter ATP-binding protein